MLKSIAIVYKKPGLSDEEFNRHWKEKHGPLAARLIPGLKKYTQNHIVAMLGERSDVGDFIETWYDDLEAYQRFLAWRQSGEARELSEDAGQFMSRAVRYVVEEHVIV
jgi:uncharacterized protein (TIGR02118 family)